jgi:hypothetical protein
MADVANRYAGLDLFVARNVHEGMTDLVSRSDADGKPFARQVDLWWVAIGIGLQVGRRSPLPPPEERVKFNTAAILSSDPWRIIHLELLALAEEGADALDNPNRVLLIAGEYAATGLKWIVEHLIGEVEPILTLMNRLDEFPCIGAPKSMH